MITDDNRSRILQRVATALGRSAKPVDIEATFRQLIGQIPKGQKALRGIDDAIDRFTGEAASSGARIENLDSLARLPEWLNALAGRSQQITVSGHPELAELNWLQPMTTEYRKNAVWAVVKAAAGVAETASLCIHSREVPSGLIYLAEVLVVILDCHTIVQRYEDLWRHLQLRPDAAFPPPRALHLITGPSRTADVEQKLQIGAHGPKEVYIVMYQGATSGSETQI